MPLPSTLFHNIRSLLSLRNASRITVTDCAERQTDRRHQDKTRKMQGEGIAFVSCTQAWSWYCGCVGFRDQVCPGPESPLVLDAPALTLHHAARRRCRKRSKADPVVHWPGSSFGGTAPEGSRASHRRVTSLAAHGATGGHCKSHRKNLSGLAIPLHEMLDFLIQYSYQSAVRFWR